MAGVITALKIQKHNKERVNVFLDDQYAFAVTVMVAATLRQGQRLTDLEIDRLKNEDERGKAYQQAVRFLGYRARSRAEMASYLQGKGYASEIVNGTIDRLLSERYLDDEAFARSWLENREALKPKGERFLRYELRQKGIADSIIDRVLTGLDEEDAARRALESKLYRWRTLTEEEFKKKAMGFLSRRGFAYETVRDVTKRAWSDMNLSD